MTDPSNVNWLADQLELMVDDELSEITHDAAPNHLVVFVRGGYR